MSSITPALRRRFLALFPAAATAASGFVASPAIALAAADPFFAIWQEFQASEAAKDEAQRRYNVVLDDPMADPALVDAECDAFYRSNRTYFDARDKACETPATTIPGIMIQLQYIERHLASGQLMTWFEYSMLKNAIRGLEVLGS